MEVRITENAEENLWQIYRYHAAYSPDYADEIQVASLMTEINRDLKARLKTDGFSSISEAVGEN